MNAPGSSDIGCVGDVLDKGTEAPINVWNDAHSDHARSHDAERHWYVAGRRLLEEAELCSGRAVDLGCGMGEFIEVLQRMGFDACGLDGEPVQVAHVKRWGFDAVLGDLEKELPFPSNQFHLATCLEVIEHVARAEHLLGEISRILHPQGYLLLSTPNFAIWQNRIRCLLGCPPFNEGIHLRFFTPGRLEYCLSEAGFGIVQRNSFGPVSGLNFLRRSIGKSAVRWRVPTWAESVFAEHLVYLCRNVR